MTDLVERLNAALEEDKRIALQGEQRLPDIWIAEGRTVFDHHAWPVAEASGDDVYAFRVAAHAARHDPDRVLRQVAAHRKILDFTEVLRADYRDSDADYLINLLAEIYGLEP